MEDVIRHRIDETHEDYQVLSIRGSVALLASHINNVNEPFFQNEPKMNKTFEEV